MRKHGCLWQTPLRRRLNDSNPFTDLFCLIAADMCKAKSEHDELLSTLFEDSVVPEQLVLGARLIEWSRSPEPEIQRFQRTVGLHGDEFAPSNTVENKRYLRK